MLILGVGKPIRIVIIFNIIILSIVVLIRHSEVLGRSGLGVPCSRIMLSSSPTAVDAEHRSYDYHCSDVPNDGTAVMVPGRQVCSGLRGCRVVMRSKHQVIDLDCFDGCEGEEKQDAYFDGRHFICINIDNKR